MDFKSLKKYFSNKIQLIDTKMELKSFQKLNIVKLKSGSDNFDLILDGGFQFGKSYVIYGQNSTGKTQLCHQICIEAFKMGCKTIYIDTENTFRPERISELCKLQKLGEVEVLKNILIAKVMSSDTLKFKIGELEENIRKYGTKLVIIDTINKYFRLEQGKSYENSKNQFIDILKKLLYLTKIYELVLVTTAQVTPKFTEKSVIKQTPVGIRYLNHFFTEFLYLSKIKNKHFVRLTNSSNLNETKLPYQITSEGIKDAN